MPVSPHLPALGAPRRFVCQQMTTPFTFVPVIAAANRCFSSVYFARCPPRILRAPNGLYGLLPRQYIASDLFERVEVLRGASAFLTGVTPSGTGLGGTVNLLPKRAPNQPLTQVDVGLVNNKQFNATADVARRFGPDDSTGLRVVATHRQGKTAIDHEHNREDLLQAGLDWHNADTRLSADVGYQNHRLEQTRTNVSLGAAVTAVPSAPKSTLNWAEPWSYSKEKDTFGTLRGEHDFNDQVTGWFALGARQSKEDNSLANLTVNSNDGAGSTYRFDNVRKDRVITGEVGARAKFATGDIKHEVVGTVGTYQSRKKNGWKFDFAGTSMTTMPARTGPPVLPRLPSTTRPWLARSSCAASRWATR